MDIQEVSNRASGSPVSIGRLRTGACLAMLLAMLLEIVARLLKSAGLLSSPLRDLLGLAALLLLCGTGVYLVLRLPNRPGLRYLILGASAMLIASQLLSLTEGLAYFEGWRLLGSGMPGHNLLKSLLLLCGLILTLLVAYMAMIEAVGAELALAQEKLELAAEVEARKRTEAALKRSQRDLRGLSRHIEEVREEERTRIARELHDDLGQMLISLRLDLGTLDLELARRGHAESLPLIQSMQNTISGTVGAVRRIIAELRPGLLDDLGLAAAVEWQCREFQRRTEISCLLAMEGFNGKIPDEKGTALFRILQEALSNVARHARATAVNIELCRHADEVCLRVRDNGTGIRAQDMEKEETYGLRGILERARQLGGAVDISGDDTGTLVQITLPVE